MKIAEIGNVRTFSLSKCAVSIMYMRSQWYGNENSLYPFSLPYQQKLVYLVNNCTRAYGMRYAVFYLFLSLRLRFVFLVS